MDTCSERPHQAGGGLADAAETQDHARRAVQCEHGFPHAELAPGQLGVALRQAAGQGEGHCHDVFGHRLGVGTGVAGKQQPLRHGRVVDGVGAGDSSWTNRSRSESVRAPAGSSSLRCHPTRTSALRRISRRSSSGCPVHENNPGRTVKHAGIDAR